jgi:hypothetical protein
MDPLPIVIIVAATAAVVGVALAWWNKDQRSKALRERFGPEYQRALEAHGGRSGAENELAARRDRVERLPIRQLTPIEHEGFSTKWRIVQARFVDDPQGAIQDADVLVQDLMRARGYPIGSFEQRAADISVDHPRVVEDYRAAHRMVPGAGAAAPDTEDLRQAMVLYRTLFEELLERAEAEHRAA